jgi:hypothetical protein
MKLYPKESLVIILLFTLLPTCLLSQVTKIMGTVTDKKSNEPIPFVTIAFKGTQTGTTTDFNGTYSLEVKKAGDSVSASCLGYIPVAKKVIKNKFQVIDFELSSVSLTLQEVVIKPGKNPAEIILEKIIKNKKFNDENSIDYYQYEVYNKVQIDVNNITDRVERSKLFKSFNFIFNYVDTSSVNGKRYLPIFISEVISDYYHRKSPKTNREIVKATRNSGIDNKSITQFLGNLYLNINIYDNYIKLLDKNFISPVSDFGLGFYKYYLLDSSYIGNKWCYKIMFKPRRKQELTFTGNMWVNDSSWAVRKVNLRIADDANINFVNDIVCNQEYSLIDKKHWMLAKEDFIIDFNLIVNSKKTLGFYGHKKVSYNKFVFETPAVKKIYDYPDDVIVKDEAFDKSEDYWLKNRHDTLDKKEQGVYKMVDSLNKVPAFNTYVKLIKMLSTGYYPAGNFEFGTYLQLYSFNQLEGNRIRLGVRSSNKFSTSFMPEAYLAYGFGDKKFKYGGGLKYMFSKTPRRDIGFYYEKDLEQLGESLNSFIDDNILASLLRRSPNNKLTPYEEYKGYYEHEWFNGFSNTINFFRRNMNPLKLNTEPRFQFIGNSGEIINMNSITTSEFRFDMRFAYKEKYLKGEFERINITTYYPVLNIQYTHGFKGLWNGDFNCKKLVIGLEQWFNVRSFGYSSYIIEAGKVWNTLPFPLLKLLEGNETISFDPYSFNRMNYYEFVADEYLSFYYSHHFDGYFLNHIPLMRKLKWREVCWFKGVVGRLSNSNYDYNKIEMEKVGMNPLTKPYFETGLGVENIFKVFRVDATWRLSYLKSEDFYNPSIHQTPSPFGIMVTFQFIL